MAHLGTVCTLSITDIIQHFNYFLGHAVTNKKTKKKTFYISQIDCL